jgi:hypothetical protein
MERAQVLLQQIVHQGPHGRQMVRLLTLRTFPPALTLTHYSDPIFFLHHAVSNQ